jgi:hypothetical protein
MLSSAQAGFKNELNWRLTDSDGDWPFNHVRSSFKLVALMPKSRLSALASTFAKLHSNLEMYWLICALMGLFKTYHKHHLYPPPFASPTCIPRPDKAPRPDAIEMPPRARVSGSVRGWLWKKMANKCHLVAVYPGSSWANVLEQPPQVRWLFKSNTDVY